MAVKAHTITQMQELRKNYWVELWSLVHEELRKNGRLNVVEEDAQKRGKLSENYRKEVESLVQKDVLGSQWQVKMFVKKFLFAAHREEVDCDMFSDDEHDDFIGPLRAQEGCAKEMIAWAHGMVSHPKDETKEIA
jgi:hypothetical protein